MLISDSHKIVNPILVFLFGWLTWLVIFILTPINVDIAKYLNHPALGSLIE